jgi:predicted nucleotidyltransferase
VAQATSPVRVGDSPTGCLFHKPGASSNKGFSKIKFHANLPFVTTIPQGLLEKAIERLKAEFRPEQIYLFGSHAWGAPHEDSDVDLMVIVRESGDRAIRRMQRAHRCLRGLRLSKDVFVQTREEFDRYKDLRASLQHQIMGRGKKLYG